MPRSTFVDYVVNDLFQGVRGVRARAMFGGHGVYQNDVIFAIIAYDALYFKVGDSNRHDYEKLGSEPFTYEVKGRKPVTMSYWSVPGEVMDDRELLVEWMAKAVKVSKSAYPDRTRKGKIRA